MNYDVPAFAGMTWLYEYIDLLAPARLAPLGLFFGNSILAPSQAAVLPEEQFETDAVYIRLSQAAAE
ncbi:MAG: hypothetical protein ACOYK6_08290 [Chthoniobacterales bacterium]